MANDYCGGECSDILPPGQNGNATLAQTLLNRAVPGEPAQGGPAQKYCGGGTLSGCRDVLISTLKETAGKTASQVYPGDVNCSADDQWCADSIIQRPLGGINHGKISWQNRPTFQQVVEFTSHR